MKKSTAVKEWELFEACFKLSDEVVVIFGDDKITWGRLIAYDDEGFTLRRFRKTETHPWDDVRFMSHDGFPVRKLQGADGSRLIEKLDTRSTQALIRKALTHILCGTCSELMEDDAPIMRWPKVPECRRCRKNRIRRERSRMVFGDPFMVEGVTGSLFNSGNGGPEWWGEEYEEAILLESADGALGILYDVPTIYHYELY